MRLTAKEESSLFPHVKEPLLRQTLLHAGRFVKALHHIESEIEPEKIRFRLENIKAIADEIAPFYLQKEIQDHEEPAKFFHPKVKKRKIPKPLLATVVRLTRWANKLPSESDARKDIRQTARYIYALRFECGKNK